MLIIAIIMLLGVSYAQKSLFDIEFDAPIAATEAMLKAKGFVETSRDGTKINYGTESIPGLSSLELYMNNEQTSVDHWKLYYDISSDPDLESSVLIQLGEIHGEYQVKDDYDYDYVWYYDSGKALYVSTDAYLRMVLNYTEGNWRDDDWYYYGWF